MNNNIQRGRTAARAKSIESMDHVFIHSVVGSISEIPRQKKAVGM